MKLIVWLILSLILILIWEVFTRIIPEGLFLAPVNVLFFLGSGVIAALGYLPYLKKRFGNVLGWAFSVLLWFIVFVFIRSMIFPPA